jgi:transposase
LATARAYQWRLGFDGFFDQPAELAEDYLERWYQGATRSRLDPIIDFAHMVGEHWEGVLRWHWTKINNGVLEGINAPRPRVPQQAEPDRDDLPDRRPT